jgi:peptidyl-prolyl cis-trans isomerase SurA
MTFEARSLLKANVCFGAHIICMHINWMCYTCLSGRERVNSTNNWRGESVQLKSIWTWVSVLLLSFVLGSCKSGSNPDVSADTAAIVNKKEIKLAEVEKMFQNKVKQSNQKPSTEEAQALRLDILRQLIDNEMLMQQAAKEKLEATESEISAKFTELKKNFTEERFQEFLKQQGLTAAEIREEMKKNITIEKLLNKEITSKISVSDAEIKDFFSNNKQNFNLPDAWHVYHILITPKRNQAQVMEDRHTFDAQTVQEAQDRAVRVLKRVLGGEDFQVVARDNSDDSASAQSGGDLGFLSAQQMQQIGPGFRQAVETLKPGETFSKPIVTQYGFHIVRVTEKNPAGQRELSDPAVQANIRQAILSRRDDLYKSAYLDKIRNEASVRNVMAEKIFDQIGTTAQTTGKK